MAEDGVKINRDVITVNETTLIKDFPRGNLQLVGREEDPTRTVFNRVAFEAANADLLRRSYATGTFHETAGVFFGEYFTTPNGSTFIVVTQWTMAQGIGQPGHFAFTPEGWIKVLEELQSLRANQGNSRLKIVGWGHTHPNGWAGRPSTEDVTNHTTYFPAIGKHHRFMYIYAAGQGRDTPITINNHELTDTHALFSIGASGKEVGGGMKQHKGFYLQ